MLDVLEKSNLEKQWSFYNTTYLVYLLCLDVYMNVDV